MDPRWRRPAARACRLVGYAYRRGLRRGDPPAATSPSTGAGRCRLVARGRWQVSLRVTLVTLLVGLLLATVSSIAVVEFVTTSRSIQELESRFFSMLSIAVNGRVQTYLEPAIPVLEEARTRAQYGRLAVDDEDELAAFLVDRLRYQKNLSWLSYSDEATGRFVGAWRDADGTIVLNQSSPAVDGGRPLEAVVGVDGGRPAAVPRPARAATTRASATGTPRRAARDGIIWTEPFEFDEGRMGITAAVAVRAPDTDQLRGVFTADFFLDDVSRFLADLVEGQPRPRRVLSRKGEVIARSYAPDATGPALLAAGLRAAPTSLAAMTRGRPGLVHLRVRGRALHRDRARCFGSPAGSNGRPPTGCPRRSSSTWSTTISALPRPSACCS